MRNLWKNYNLSIVAMAIFLVMLTIYTIFGWHEYGIKQRELNNVATVFGDSGFIWFWGEALFANWQSEFLQTFVFVILTAIFIHKGSAESKDTEEAILAKLNAMQKQLDTLQADSSSTDSA